MVFYSAWIGAVKEFLVSSQITDRKMVLLHAKLVVAG